MNIVRKSKNFFILRDTFIKKVFWKYAIIKEFRIEYGFWLIKIQSKLCSMIKVKLRITIKKIRKMVNSWIFQ